MNFAFESSVLEEQNSVFSKDFWRKPPRRMGDFPC